MNHFLMTAGKGVDFMNEILINQCIFMYEKNLFHLDSETKEVLVNTFKKEILDNNLFVVPRIELAITTHCSLKCAHCSHLMYLYEEPYHIPAKEVITNIEKFLDCIDQCVCIGITGGEPMLHQELKSIVDALVSFDKVHFIDITTNGTIIPDEETIRTMKNKKIFVKISNYGKSTQPQKLASLLEQNNISYKLYKDYYKWVDFGNFQFRNKKKSALYYDYIQCSDGSYCKTILKNTIYGCHRAAYMSDIGLYSCSDSDKVDLSESDKQKRTEEIKNLFNTKYMDVCNYCDKPLNNFINAGEQIIFAK